MEIDFSDLKRVIDEITEKNKFSVPELKIKKILDDLNVDYEVHNRNLISPLEVDFYVPKYKVAIEVNPTYTHNLNSKGKSYHFEKWVKCSGKGIRLISVFDNMSEICTKDMIQNALSELKDFTVIKKKMTNEHRLFIKLYGFEEFEDCEVLEVKEKNSLIGVCPIFEYIYPILLKQSESLWKELSKHGILKINNNLYSYKDTHRILQTIPDVFEILDSSRKTILVSTCGYSLIKQEQ